MVQWMVRDSVEYQVLYHTFKCHSGRSYLRLLLLDQLGIILLIVVSYAPPMAAARLSAMVQSSFLPGLQLAFYCKPSGC